MNFRSFGNLSVYWFIGGWIVLSPVSWTNSYAGINDHCLECHSEEDFTKERDGKEISLFVDKEKFERSVHGEKPCTFCHPDAARGGDEHPAILRRADCARCHEKEAAIYRDSLHGQALKKGLFLAPNCYDCHGKHDVLHSGDLDSHTNVMKIHLTCGRCHKEGTKVNDLKDVDEKAVLEDYSQSIHGDGVLKRGLRVSAVCTSCHRSHDILPHQDPKSSINRDNIAKTCMQCHALIEQVHRQVIDGRVWEEKENVAPDCIDCHKPHKVQRVFYERSFPDDLCLNCHEKADVVKETPGGVQSLRVRKDDFEHSIHKSLNCVKCHSKVNHLSDPVCLGSAKVDCAACHVGVDQDYAQSVHGKLNAANKPNAPKCTTCHGGHGIKGKKDKTSAIFSLNIPELCGNCHREGGKATLQYKGKEHEIVKRYTMSIHGKGLLESGLLVTSTCIDCHTSHHELPANDPQSTVHRNNIAETCAKCHHGIKEKFDKSIHSPLVNKTDKKLPVCKDCHPSHRINRVDLSDFRQSILVQCGNCHPGVAATYFDTFHGKVSKLGSAKTARCHDCHGSHDVLPPANPKSLLSRDNVVETCKQCHPNSNRKFVGYLTHATHHDRAKYPYLFYSFWSMTILLVGTFLFFWVHTMLWLPRIFKEQRKKKKAPKTADHHRYVQRFDAYSRFLHILVIVSFLSLAITGLTIKFAEVRIFQIISSILGGFEVTGFIHRFAALITFLYFGLHLGYLVYSYRKSGKSILDFLFNPNGLIPGKQDLFEFVQTIKWFVGAGPHPSYGRFTYWEKFDYFAVFWGIAIIGISGLLLWFSEFFTNAIGMPGWILNVATIIHSDEALLATGFIFTVHFFNTHFRPDRFPMDPVIFTGRVSVEELKEDRSREYRDLIDRHALDAALVGPPTKFSLWFGRIFGLGCLTIGIGIVIAVIYAMLFLYK